MQQTTYLHHTVTEENIHRAMAQFDRDIRRDFQHLWRKYVFYHKGKPYPPKRIVSLAIREPVIGGGPPFNTVLSRLGFPVIVIDGIPPIVGLSSELDAKLLRTTLEESYAEGREQLRLHKRRERNKKLVRHKKRHVLGVKGKLVCEACDFDFAEVYGPLGQGFAECHHRHVLSEGPGERLTKLSDLAVVCANCHRMLHCRPWRKVEELRELVRSRRRK